MYGYTEYRWACIFFIIYLIIGLFFLLNLLLAVFCNYYNQQVEAVALKVLDAHTKYMQQGLDYLEDRKNDEISESIEGRDASGLMQDAPGFDVKRKSRDGPFNYEDMKKRTLKVGHCALLIQEMHRAGYYIYIYTHTYIYIYIYRELKLKGFTGYDTLAQLLDTDGTGMTTEEDFIRFVDFLKVKTAKNVKSEKKRIKKISTPPCIFFISMLINIFREEEACENYEKCDLRG